MLTSTSALAARHDGIAGWSTRIGQLMSQFHGAGDFIVIMNHARRSKHAGADESQQHRAETDAVPRETGEGVSFHETEEATDHQ